MKKMNRKADGKQKPSQLIDEERDFKIRALKAERRDKYKSKNQRIHHWLKKDEDWENDWESFNRA